MEKLDTEIAKVRDATTVDTLAVIYRNQAIHYFESAIIAIGRPVNAASGFDVTDYAIRAKDQSVRMLIRLARQSVFKFTATKDDPARNRR